METYTEAKNSTEKHFFTTNEDKKRNARLSREKKIKTKNLEKMRQNTGKKFYLQKETDKNTHTNT